MWLDPSGIVPSKYTLTALQAVRSQNAFYRNSTCPMLMPTVRRYLATRLGELFAYQDCSIGPKPVTVSNICLTE